MKISEREPGDVTELIRRARDERQARQRDRYRAVLLALEGREAVAIAASLGRARRSVQDWVYAYRDGGIDALIPKKQPGKTPKLTAEQQTQLKARLDAGPLPRDGVCTLRGRDVVRILEREFGVRHTLGSIYGVPHRLGYSCLSPRPLHEKSDPRAIAEFKNHAPFVEQLRQTLASGKQKVRVWFMDEARFGQQGTITRVWATTASRPRAVRQTRYEWVYLYAAVEPATGESAALLAPNVNTGTMNAFLSILDAERKPGEQFVLILDQAGWHKSKTLKLPEGITPLPLPPYSPELNPVENLWHYPRSHFLSNRTYADYNALLDAGRDAYRQLTPRVIRSVCACPYLERAN